MMPLYEFACTACGQRSDEVRTIGCRDEPGTCPSCENVTERDAVASMRPHTDLEYHTPIFSNGAGINPEQIPDAMRAFPHHEYTPDGRMVFRSHRQRQQALKDIGMMDLR